VGQGFFGGGCRLPVALLKLVGWSGGNLCVVWWGVVEWSGVE